ncbi:hypothetical protein Trydic_g7358 [Trypoxylus dichotomus]
MSAIYTKRDLSFIYNIQDFVPLIIDSIEKCDTVDELCVTTHCLNNINALITEDIMVKYIGRLSKFLEFNKIGSSDYKAVINILMLLSLPQWRNKHAGLIVCCISLMKDHLYLLNVNELLVVYEIFCKIQEPGHMLNEIQRCASKYLVQLEEEMRFLPDKHEQFFQTAIDIILRDQQRMSGLSYLQACLALCFFNTLPQSFIQQIFNVEFLEKLDVELANCYFKDIYPSRVRYLMMQLNRAVCLDYPESNIPWFHQKYIEQRRSNVDSIKDYAVFKSIKDCLLKLAKDENSIEENRTSPYGYHINFILHLDKNDEFVTTDKAAKRVAILIMKPNFYCRFHKQLKGFYQLKIRHLEILGYKVAVIDSSFWRKLDSFEEKLNYLINTVKSDEIYTRLIRTLREVKK